MTSLFDKQVEPSLGREKLCLLIGEEVILKYQAPYTFLEGFDTIRAVTFSSSGKVLFEFLKNFQYIEILIGVEEKSCELDYLTKIREDLNLLLPAFFHSKEIAIYHLSNCHSKLYLLSKAGEPVQRAILGSANLSQSAWLGTQEELFVIIDNRELIENLEKYYETLKGKAKPIITKEIKEKLNEEAKRCGLNINIEKAYLSEDLIKQRENLKDVVANIFLRNVALNLPLEQYLPKLREKRVSLEKTESFLERLKEKKPHFKLAGSNLEKLKKVTQDLKDSQPQRALEWDPLSGHFLYKSLAVIQYPEEIELERKVVSSLREYLELSRESSYKHPTLIGEAIVFAFNAPLMHLIRQKAYQAGLDLNSFPIFALLAGTAKAGKSTILEVVARLLGTSKTNYRAIPKRGNTQANTIEDLLFSKDLMPYLIDEVSPQHFSVDKSLQSVLKHASESVETTGTLMLTSNLQDFSGEIQILRRACFLPFEFQVKSEKGKGIERILRGLNPALFLKFLRYISTQKLEAPDPQDPLRIAREFLLNEGVPVPESYQGRYEEVIRKGWKILYQSSPEIFEEIEAESKHFPGKKVKCFKVPKEKVGFLTPLETFENYSTFPDYYLLLKEEFLQEIGESRDSFLNRLKKIFT